MNELTPTEIAFINEVNSITHRIACAHRNTFNHARVSFFGRIGGTGGVIEFAISDKLYCGEYDFRSREECLERLNFLYSGAASGRLW